MSIRTFRVILHIILSKLEQGFDEKFKKFHNRKTVIKNTKECCLLNRKVRDTKMMQCMQSTWYLYNRGVLFRTWVSAKELFYATKLLALPYRVLATV